MHFRVELGSLFHQNENILDIALNGLKEGVQLTDQEIIYDCGKIIGLDKFGQPTSKVFIVLSSTLESIRTMYPI